jgi:hypothetical protein
LGQWKRKHAILRKDDLPFIAYILHTDKEELTAAVHPAASPDGAGLRSLIPYLGHFHFQCKALYGFRSGDSWNSSIGMAAYRSNRSLNFSLSAWTFFYASRAFSCTSRGFQR